MPVIEIVALEGDGVDPSFYQRFAGAIAMLRRGDSPEPELRGLLRERPERPGDRDVPRAAAIVCRHIQLK